MNILVFSTVFHPAIGGLENQTLILLKEFIKNGHTVKVITDQKQHLPTKDFEIYDSPSLFKKIRLFLWCNAYYMPNISLKGVWLLLFNPILLQRKKWIVSHNDFYLENKVSYKIRLKRFLIKFASGNISVSSSVAGYINTDSTVIYNAYDDSVFKLYPDEIRNCDVVFLGRLVSQKGCDILVKAFSKIDPTYHLTIIGDGPEKSKLKHLVQELGIKDRVKFMGTIRGVELAKLLNRHKIMVVPSASSEGFGMVVLEGMACGCKMIASNAAGLVEAINGYGEIFEMNNVDELAYVLTRELTRHNGDPVLTAPIQEYLANHNRSIVSSRYLELFVRRNIQQSEPA
ncbi:MAG: glycosyltransferase family 1 protein [Sphingobacteriaceae bacterium]|nr:MAG: glycosyltransferase family 1 protein [Sphingobacteriaceae bacterium]